ncbi:MAG TPA: LacI family DNA-binding transcriptional regulator [Spirochaetales bacterium]|nr:LacI family DNA-binding transcriptional regulator [Spirochaetales bacterium]
MKKPRLRSIDDLAKLAGVSKSTVSRALNDSPLVGVATKDKILALAKDYDFRPSVTARALSTRSSRTVAFVIDAYDPECGLHSPFSLEIMGGAATGLHELGYGMLIVQADGARGDWAEEYLVSGRVDGFILMTYENKRRHVQALVDLEAPFTVWGSCDMDPCCSVSTDNRLGGRLAGEHLVATGRRRIGFIGGSMDDSEVVQRLLGFSEAVAIDRSLHTPGLEAFGDFSEPSGFVAMNELLDRDGSVDAVFAAGDMMAIGAIRALATRGRRVPDDVAIVGYDDLFVSAFTTPSLTTISQHIADTGRTLASRLVANIERGVVESAVVPVELIKRDSA